VSIAAVEKALEAHQAAGAATPFFLHSVKELTGAKTTMKTLESEHIDCHQYEVLCLSCTHYELVS